MTAHYQWHDFVLDAGVFVMLLVGHIWGVLAHATTVLAFALVCIRLYETKTVPAALIRAKRWLCG